MTFFSDDRHTGNGHLSRVSPLHPAHFRPPSFGVLSTYPPTQCGLATFASALVTGFESIGVERVGVVRTTDDALPVDDRRVVAQLAPDSPDSLRHAVHALSAFDFALIQHEFGIFGGTDGNDVLKVMREIRVPSIVTLHTIPLQPRPHQRDILEEVVDSAAIAVTMTDTARQRLLSVYDVSADNVVTIPHGATLPLTVAPATTSKTTLLTWGLLGPGKGIEWVVDALALVSDLDCDIEYVIAGRTHPKVLAREGEAYRNMLKERVNRLGLKDKVIFDETYYPLPDLLTKVSQSTCVVLPYDSDDQITSGVLVDAIAAARPVIATEFPHAKELLAHGCGILVPHRDPESMAAAIRCIATRRDVVASMGSVASDLAPDHSWAAVAARYVDVASSIDLHDAIRGSMGRGSRQ